MKKTTTKLLCIVMSIGLIAVLAGCGVAGTYELKDATLSYGGETLDMDDLNDLGLDLDGSYIELKSDGTGEMELMGESEDIEWEDDELWPEGDEDEAIEFELDGDELTIELEGMTLVFEKE